MIVEHESPLTTCFCVTPSSKVHRHTQLLDDTISSSGWVAVASSKLLAFFMLHRILLRPFTPSSSFFRPLISTSPSTHTLLLQRTISLTAVRMAQEFKLKDLTTLSDLKNTDKKEAEVEGIEGGKVLIVKVQDQLHALNANCTHFGAPLKNGVVTKEGRLTCPWHGGQTLALV